MNDKNYGFLDYTKLWEYLNKKGLKKEYLHKNGMHSNTIAKLVKNESVNSNELCKLCCILNTDIKNIVEYRKPEKTD